MIVSRLTHYILVFEPLRLVQMHLYLFEVLIINIPAVILFLQFNPFSQLMHPGKCKS